MIKDQPGNFPYAESDSVDELVVSPILIPGNVNLLKNIQFGTKLPTDWLTYWRGLGEEGELEIKYNTYEKMASERAVWHLPRLLPRRAFEKWASIKVPRTEQDV